MSKHRAKSSSEILVTLSILIISFTMLSYSPNVNANSPNDAKTFSTFDQLNSQDIETAILAVTRGQSDAVRMVGQMIINDHIPLLTQMRKMTNNKGVHLKNHENGRALAHQAMMNSLLNKSSEEFDKAYLDHELRFSQDFVKTLKESMIPNTNDQTLKDFLTTTLVRFEEHLSHINHAAMMLNSQNGKANDVIQGHKHKH